MSVFRESDHPRDGDGKFTDKNGVSVSGATDIDKLVKVADKVREQKQAKEYVLSRQVLKYQAKIAQEKYAKDKPKIQSAVFDKISTVKSQLNRKGYAFITVYTCNYKYKVKLYNEIHDYEYIILWRKTL